MFKKCLCRSDFCKSSLRSRRLRCRIELKRADAAKKLIKRADVVAAHRSGDVRKINRADRRLADAQYGLWETAAGLVPRVEVPSFGSVLPITASRTGSRRWRKPNKTAGFCGGRTRDRTLDLSRVKREARTGSNPQCLEKRRMTFVRIVLHPRCLLNRPECRAKRIFWRRQCPQALRYARKEAVLRDSRQMRALTLGGGYTSCHSGLDPNAARVRGCQRRIEKAWLRCSLLLSGSRRPRSHCLNGRP